ncbi:Major facilitator superfamily domain, general substrate transporter [Penicillium expansum]|nr:Major facilitator superfamily domain, general substrate transporter [Penicillium expansum]
MGSDPIEVEVEKEEPQGCDLLIDFEHPNDPRIPQNWPLAKKILVVVILSVFNLIGTISSSIMGPAQKRVAEQFGANHEVAILCTTLFMGGYIFGFLTFGPLSEKFGRKWPLIGGVAICSLLELMPALGTNIQTIVIGRLFAGFFGVSPVAVMGGITSDCFTLAHRSIAMPIVICLFFSGPTFGPIVGSAIVGSSLSWRWTIWVMLICGLGVCAIAAFVFPETYPPAILRKEAQLLRKKYKNPAIRSALEKETSGIHEFARVYLLRPFWLFATQPILALLTIYHSFLYGVLFLFYQAYPYYFGEIRGWNTSVDTLPLLGIITGVFIGTLGIIIYNQAYFRHHCYTSDGTFIPEARLPPMILGGVLIPIGIFWFAWTAQPNVPWPSPLCAGLFMGCGMYLLFIQGFIYIVDCYTSMANSAMGINGSMRSVFGAVFPLFATQMFEKLGVPYATTILGAVSVCLIPVPVCFWYWGGRIRAWSSTKV